MSNTFSKLQILKLFSLGICSLICLSFNPPLQNHHQTIEKFDSLINEKRINEIINLRYSIKEDLIKQPNFRKKFQQTEAITERPLLLQVYQIANSYILFQNGKTNAAFTSIDSCTNYCINHNLPIATGILYRLKGDLLLKKNKPQEALNLYFMSKRIFEDQKDSSNLSTAHYKIGKTFLMNDNFSLAEKHLFIGNKMAIRTNTQDTELNSLNCLDILFTRKLMFSKANSFFKKALHTQYATDKQKARLLQNMGGNFLNNQKYPEAKKYFQKSLTIKKELNDTFGISSISNNLGKIALLQNNPQKALDYLMESGKYHTNDDPSLKINRSFNLITIYNRLNQPDSVEKYLNLNLWLRDSVFNLNLSNKLLELETKYATEKKDKEIELLKKEDLLQEAYIKNQNILLVTIGFIAILALTFGAIVWFQRKKVSRYYKSIKKHQEALAKTNMELAINKRSLEKLLSIISHDVRGPLAGLKALFQLYREQDNISPEEFKSVLDMANESTTSTHHLVENLLHWANAQQGEIIAKPTTFNIKSLVLEIINMLKISNTSDEHNFDFDIPENLNIYSDRNQTMVVLRNLISNAIKFTPKTGGIIKVTAVSINDKVEISVIDNGRGLTSEQANLIFTKGQRFFVESPNSPKGTGLGLLLSKEFVEKNGGTIRVKSTPGNGCTFSFTSPFLKEKGNNKPQTETPSKN